MKQYEMTDSGAWPMRAIVRKSHPVPSMKRKAITIQDRATDQTYRRVALGEVLNYEFFFPGFRHITMSVIPLAAAAVKDSERPLLNPFDGLLVATVMTEKLLTANSVIARYTVSAVLASSWERKT